MIIRHLAHVFTSLSLLCSTFIHAATGTEERAGLRCISSKAFPIPEGSKSIADCDFETGDKLPEG